MSYLVIKRLLLFSLYNPKLLTLIIKNNNFANIGEIKKLRFIKLYAILKTFRNLAYRQAG